MKKLNGFLACILSAAIIFSSFSFLNDIHTSAESSFDWDKVKAIATNYVQTQQNKVTAEGLLAAVKTYNSQITLDKNNDFYIRHAINGAKDNATDYPLDIKGSDGAVSAIFEYNGTRYGFTCGFSHSVEIINVTKTAIVGTSEGFTYDTSGNVTGYTGDADKIVFPAGYNGTMLPVSDFTSINNVKVVIIDNTKTTLLVKQGFYNWDGLVAVQISGDASHYFFTQYGSGDANNEKIFAECDNLKYVKLPAETKAAGWNTGYLPYKCFENSVKLETVILPKLVHTGAPFNHPIPYRTFMKTAVREFVFPEHAGSEASEAFASPTFGEGTRNKHYYNENMTFMRATALIAAAFHKEKYTTGSEAIAAAKAAIVGSADSASFAESLTYTWNVKGTNSKSYTLTVSNGTDSIDIASGEQSTTTLKSLNTNYGLSPEFDADCLEYNVLVPYDVVSLELTYEAAENASVASIIGSENFKVGKNVIIINVVSSDGNTVTYQINVERKGQLLSDDILKAVNSAAKNYVIKTKNNVTKDGLVNAINTVIPGATIVDEDFYIRHAVPGVTDKMKDGSANEYPLNIPGNDGAVVAVFTYEGNRYTFNCAFEHEKEVLEIEEVAFVGTLSDDFVYDNEGNLIAYNGTADKLIVPPTFKKMVGYNNTDAKEIFEGNQEVKTIFWRALRKILCKQLFGSDKNIGK